LIAHCKRLDVSPDGGVINPSSEKTDGLRSDGGDATAFDIRTRFLAAAMRAKKK